MGLSGPVLVATDLSSAADEAIRQAAELARSLDARLIVCHVIPELIPDGSIFAEFRRAHVDLEQSIFAKARAAVQEQLDNVVGTDNAGAEVALETGTPLAGVITQAEEASAGVVVTGPGSLAVDVVRHAFSGVLVARPSRRGPVVGATDFSDASLPALGLAASEAARRGSHLHVLHAFDVGVFASAQAPATVMPYLAGSPIALEGIEELRAIAKSRLDQTLHDLGVAGETAVVSGSAADTIVQYAESVKAELVVVGTHGRSGLARLTLGSTASSVIESAPCSVLVTRMAVT